MIYSYCEGQVITAGEANQPMAISTLAVLATIDLFRVQDRKNTFEKIVKAFNWLTFRKDESYEGS